VTAVITDEMDMKDFVDSKARAYTEAWFNHMWVEGGDLYELCHEEAMFYGFKSGLDVASYTKFRALMLNSFCFKGIDVVAGVASENAIQTIGSCEIFHRRSNNVTQISGGQHLRFSNGKVIAWVGFFDYSGLINFCDPIDDKELIEIILPGAASYSI